MTFRNYIYNLCKNTDLDNKEDVIKTMKFLALRVIQLNDVATTYENKLQEVLSYKEFNELTTTQAKVLFKSEIDSLDDGEFKDFIIDNFDIIINDK